MDHRSWGTLALAWLQLGVEPVGNLLSHLLHERPWSARMILTLIGLPAVLGGAVLSMRSWSFPVVVLASLGILYRDCVILSAAGQPLWLALLPFAANLAISGYLLLPALASWHRDPKLGWFVSNPLYQAELEGSFETEGGRVFPCKAKLISLSGAFLEGANADSSYENGVRGVFRSALGVPGDPRTVRIPAEIRFSRATGRKGVGYGVRFLGMSDDARQGLDTFVQGKQSQGEVVLHRQCRAEDFQLWFWTHARGFWVAFLRDVRSMEELAPVGPPPFVGRPDLKLVVKSEAEPQAQSAKRICA